MNAKEKPLSPATPRLICCCDTATKGKRKAILIMSENVFFIIILFHTNASSLQKSRRQHLWVCLRLFFCLRYVRRCASRYLQPNNSRRTFSFQTPEATLYNVAPGDGGILLNVKMQQNCRTTTRSSNHSFLSQSFWPLFQLLSFSLRGEETAF